MQNKLVVSVIFLVTVVAGARISYRSKKARPYFDDDICLDDPEFVTPHDDCSMYWECDENFELQERWCDEGLIFDFEFFYCGAPGEAICWDEDYPEINDSDCPLNTNEVIFLPSQSCEEYFICMNGVPMPLQCRNGQHWNIDENVCDDPHTAGCDVNAIPSLPDCQRGFVGTIPHPSDCHRFIYCDNGNRLIQNCQHLHHYDTLTNSCMFVNKAKCTESATVQPVNLRSRVVTNRD